jgi:hypothetical protein
VGERQTVEKRGGNEMSPSEDYGPQDRPRTRTSCHVRKVGPDHVVYEPVSHEVVILNATAHFIFASCDGSRTVAEIEDALVARYAADRDVLRRDLVATLQLLRSKGLLAPER